MPCCTRFLANHISKPCLLVMNSELKKEVFKLHHSPQLGVSVSARNDEWLRTKTSACKSEETLLLSQKEQKLAKACWKNFKFPILVVYSYFLTTFSSFVKLSHLLSLGRLAIFKLHDLMYLFSNTFLHKEITKSHSLLNLLVTETKK